MKFEELLLSVRSSSHRASFLRNARHGEIVALIEKTHSVKLNYRTKRVLKIPLDDRRNGIETINYQVPRFFVYLFSTLIDRKINFIRFVE